MPYVKIDETFDMFFEVDDYVDPWQKSEAILLVHGIGGCSKEWYAWPPGLARKYTVFRIDLRGWGKSTVPPEGYQWSMVGFADDIRRFMDKVGLEKVHLVGTKLGGRIALHFARNFPNRLRSLTLISTPMSLKSGNQSNEHIPTKAGGRKAVEKWARSTMRERLGEVADDMMEWWIDLYRSHSPRVLSEVCRLAWSCDESNLVSSLSVPTLVIDSNAQGRADESKTWQQLIPDSKMVIVPVNNEGRQISASKPDACISILLEYLRDLSHRTQSS
jgi:3-oxoadipate enol-lactonase